MHRRTWKQDPIDEGQLDEIQQLICKRRLNEDQLEKEAKAVWEEREKKFQSELLPGFSSADSSSCRQGWRRKRRKRRLQRKS